MSTNDGVSNRLHAVETIKYEPGLEVPSKSLGFWTNNYLPPHEQYQDHHSLKRQRKHFIHGLNDVMHGVLLGMLVTVLTIGIGLGGGLGSKLASCQGDLRVLTASIQASNQMLAANNSIVPAFVAANSSTASSANLEDFQVPSPLTINTLRNDCDPSSRTSIWGDRYVTLCGKDSLTGAPAAEGGLIAEIMSFTAYSFMDCINACSGLNYRSTTWGFTTKCRSVGWHFDMKNSTTNDNSNCWLKNGTMLNPGAAVNGRTIMTAQLASK